MKCTHGSKFCESEPPQFDTDFGPTRFGIRLQIERCRVNVLSTQPSPLRHCGLSVEPPTQRYFPVVTEKSSSNRQFSSRRPLEQVLRPNSSVLGCSGTGRHGGGEGTVQLGVLAKKQEEKGFWIPFHHFPHSLPPLRGGQRFQAVGPLAPHRYLQS